MKYRTIVADPPWPETSKGPRGSAEHNFNLLTMYQIGFLPVHTIAEKRAHLYLWATQRSLSSAFSIMAQWGFGFKSLLSWNKPGLGTGFYYFRPNTEYILFGTWEGACHPIRRRDVGTHFDWPRPQRAQEKPPESYELFESCSYGARVELFSRQQREEWACWGNEVGDPLGWTFNPNNWQARGL